MNKFPYPAIALLILLNTCQSDESNTKEHITYPPTAWTGQEDNYFGQVVKDPYRWLENDTSIETSKWVAAQNKVTFDYLERIPYRDKIRNRLEELVNYPRFSSPVRAGKYFFFYKNDGLQNQDVIYIREGLDGNEKVFLDPNKLSREGTVAVNISSVSGDKKYVALSLSEAGSDWRELFVLEVATGKPTGDTLRWVKFSGANWFKNGFFYSRYPEQKDGMNYTSSNSGHSVYFHKIGMDQSEDKLIYSDGEHPNRYHWTDVTEDEKYVILYIAEGTDGFETHYAPLDGGKIHFEALFTGFEHKSEVIEHSKGRFLIRTDIGAPNYRLISLDVAHREMENWVEVLPERNDLLETAGTAGGKLFSEYLHNACSQVFMSDYSGKNKREIKLPGLGSAGGFQGKREDSITFYSFSSYTDPGRIYLFDLNSFSSQIFFNPELSFNPEEYTSNQVRYKSKDGTEVTMFLVYKNGMRQNGKNALLLYGYGGFNISITPWFSTRIIPWLEAGGIYAVPNLRGGGEYGEEWHKAGMLLKKQNVFDDFISAAEYLIAEGYTSSDKLVISGRSNGGLLVGAVMTQRPDLIKVALPGVGVMDMLRFHKFTVGHGWIPEYGSSDDSVNFKNLYSYSPLHNLKKGVDYPATLIYTADHDDRVVPAHSFKFAATLQEMDSGKNPTLIRIETEAGHGGGKPIAKILDEEADKLAFSFYNVGLDPFSGH